MDPIEDIKYAKDSTLAMLLAAQARGFELVYMEQNDLSLRDGRAIARMRPLERQAPTLRTGSPSASPKSRRSGTCRRHPDAQGPALRHGVHLHHLHARARRARRGAGLQPPPGPAGHEREGLHGLVPAGVRAHADHARHGATWPPSCASTARRSCKPLHGMGGRSIFVVAADDKNMNGHLRDAHRLRPAATPSSQRYIPDIVADAATRASC